MAELRVIIAGSRNFDDFSKLMDICNSILENTANKYGNFDKIRIISGTARGADRLGEQYAINMRYELSKFYPNWDGLGKRAGYVRNVEIAKFAIENNSVGVLIAFWDGKSKGTKRMIEQAAKYGLKVYAVNF